MKLIPACHVGKLHLGVSVLDDARLGFAQLERISAGATRAARACHGDVPQV